MKRILVTAIISSLLVPAAAFAAARPGTDEYLRDVLGWDEARLSTPLNTEDRKPFAFRAGEGEAADAVGDVLNRTGITAAFSLPWADLVSASLAKDEANGAWIVTWNLTEDFPTDAPDAVQWLFYADRNPRDDDNAPDEGVRGGMDAEFSIERDADGNWITDFRWYNPGADFWAMNLETAASFSFEGSRVVLRIPFEEMAADTKPDWRAVLAVSRAGHTLVDVAPTVGFPPTKDSTEETLASPPWRLPTPDLTPATVILVVATLLALAYLAFLHLSRRRKS